jgi:glutathione S-transferase
MAIKLYRCKYLWNKAPGHPCWRVMSALDDAGIEYEVVPGPWPSRKKRTTVRDLSGQSLYPVIQFENGAVYREESKDMARTIREGRLAEKAGA